MTTAAISVIRSGPNELPPVVSTSTTTYDRSASRSPGGALRMTSGRAIAGSSEPTPTSDRASVPPIHERVGNAGDKTPASFTVVRELFPLREQRHGHVVGDEPGRPWQLADVGDQVDRIGWTCRKEIAGARHEHLFGRSKSNT